MTPTLIKLAFAGIRSRLLASGLTILLSSAAAATIVLALEVGATARDPWQRTFTAANGAHVLANVSSEAEARAIAALPGVAERDEPVPIASRTSRSSGTDRLLLAGLLAVHGSTCRCGPRARSCVRTASCSNAASPTRSESRSERRSGRGRARSNCQSSARRSLPSQPRYPRSNPGLAWVTRATLARIEPDRSRWSWTQAVRLTEASAAPAFAARAAASALGGRVLLTWQDQRAEALREAQPVMIILTTYTILLLVVVFAVVAILIGARASAQYREIGLMKAVGLTPRQVTAVFALESAALGVVAVVIGFALGALLAPRLAAPAAETMLGSPTTAANPWHLLVAGDPRPARALRQRALVDPARHPLQRPAGDPGRHARARPAIATRPHDRPRLAADPARPRPQGPARPTPRAIRLAGAIAVTGAAIVVALSMKASLDAQPAARSATSPTSSPCSSTRSMPCSSLITATTLVAIALLSVRERIRDYGVLKAIGLTPRQIASSLVGAHAAVALVAALLSIPLGIGLYVAVYGIAGGSSADRVIAPWWWLALVPIATVLVVVAATSVPARLATRIPTADALRYE